MKFLFFKVLNWVWISINEPAIVGDVEAVPHEPLGLLSAEKMKERFEELGELLINFSPRLILAILVLVFGFWAVGKLTKLTERAMNRSNLSQEIRPFLKSTVNIIFKITVVLTAASILGIKSTSFAALIAAIGFAIGMALQGSLGNLAAGVMILIFKPYKVGDYVKINDELGQVDGIQLLNTHIRTFDNKGVIIPNGMAISDIITNLSDHEYIRVDLNVPMPYSSDFPTVQKIIETALKNTEHVLAEPKPFVGIETFDSHSIVLAVRPYAKTEKYWDVYFDANKNVKKALSENGIQVAYSEGVEMGKIGS